MPITSSPKKIGSMIIRDGTMPRHSLPRMDSCVRSVLPKLKKVTYGNFEENATSSLIESSACESYHARLGRSKAALIKTQSASPLIISYYSVNQMILLV